MTLQCCFFSETSAYLRLKWDQKQRILQSAISFKEKKPDQGKSEKCPSDYGFHNKNQN